MLNICSYCGQENKDRSHVNLPLGTPTQHPPTPKHVAPSCHSCYEELIAKLAVAQRLSQAATSI